MFFLVGLSPPLGLIRPPYRLLYQPNYQTVVLLMGLTRSDAQMRLCVLMGTGVAFYDTWPANGIKSMKAGFPDITL